MPPPHAEHGSDEAGLYRGYADWKGWQGALQTSDRDARYYAAELAGIDIAGKRVLEIGFGSGAFLGWASARGARVVGTELDAGLLARAREAGFDARAAALRTLGADGSRFDLVVAFDVFEHWGAAELVERLRDIHALLADDGLVLARFPNGQSPFGLAFQHGDLTHRTALSVSSVGQLAGMTGFDVLRAGNARRVSARRDPLTVLKFHWRRWRRSRIERAIGKLYGVGRLALDPNLSVLLRKA